MCNWLQWRETSCCSVDSPYREWQKWKPWVDINRVLRMVNLSKVQQAGEVFNSSRTILNWLHSELTSRFASESIPVRHLILADLQNAKSFKFSEFLRQRFLFWLQWKTRNIDQLILFGLVAVVLQNVRKSVFFHLVHCRLGHEKKSWLSRGKCPHRHSSVETN